MDILSFFARKNLVSNISVIYIITLGKKTRNYSVCKTTIMLAHITHKENQDIVQTLYMHSINTAHYASNSICEALKGAAYFCGLIHDMGKAKQEFQTYLQKAFENPEYAKKHRGKVNHTFAAVIWILENKPANNNYLEDICVEILAFVVGAHHGLFDLSDLEGNFGLKHRFEYDRDKIHYKESVNNFYSEVVSLSDLHIYYQNAISELSDIITDIVKHCTAFYDETEGNYTSYFDIGMICRMLLSAIIYGDRKDTMEFMQQTVQIHQQVSDWAVACEYYENKISTFSADSALNKVRSEISLQCLNAAKKECGIYQLDVPTGGGKTLSSFRYAINHANLYNKHRIIYVIPYLTIIEQNAEVIREFYVNSDEILEHHSNIVKDPNRSKDELMLSELLSTTWDSPVIFTTMVQFLDILFSHKTSAIGRLQSLNDSIIIFDEIQSLPRKSTYLFIQAINFLSKYCDCTAVLCSATQPSFGAVKYPLWYSENPNLITLSPEQLSVFTRTEIVDARVPYGMSIEELKEFCKEISQNSQSLMCICNTKKEAAELYHALQSYHDLDVYHISNAMCKAHINDTLNEVKKLLKDIQENKREKKLILISTQIPEAGVDISFQAVIRVLAGLDNIIQSDGRCNRSNEYTVGTTYIVNLNPEVEKTQYLPDIKYMQDASIRVLDDEKTKINLFSEESSKLYFTTLFNYTQNILGYPYDGTSLLKLLSNDLKQNENYKLTIPFSTVGHAYQVIEGATTDILVPYTPYKNVLDDLRDILANDKYNFEKIKALMATLKNCTVNLYDYQVDVLQKNGLLYSYMDKSIFVLNEKAYSATTGLIILEKQEGVGIII